MGLQGTLDTFSLAEVLGLIERARQTGALEVRGPDGHGTLFVNAGRFCAGEAADWSGPVENREALDVRLVDVCFHLFRFTGGSYEFVPNQAPSWTAERGTDIGPIVARVERIVREWSTVEAAVPSFDTPLEVADDLVDESVTLTRAEFRILTLVDGQRSLRQIARELARSVVEIGPEVRDLVEQGALRVASRQARSDGTQADPGLVLAPGALHAVRESERAGGHEPVEMVTSVPDPSAPLDPDAVARERAALAARAGLDHPGPMPDTDTPPAAERSDAEPPDHDPDRAAISTDRGALLRLFSGLRDQR